MGRPKLLLPWGDSVLIQRVLAVWLASRIERVVVVVRSSDEVVRDLCRREGAEVVIPDIDPPEMKVSVQIALRAVERRYAPRANDVWLLAPADMPHLTTACIDQLLDAYDPQDPSLIVPQYRGARGHPVLMPWRLAGEVQQLRESEPMRSLLARNPVHIVETQQAGILRDVDTLGDYRRLSRGEGRR